MHVQGARIGAGGSREMNAQTLARGPSVWSVVSQALYFFMFSLTLVAMAIFWSEISGRQAEMNPMHPYLKLEAVPFLVGEYASQNTSLVYPNTGAPLTPPLTVCNGSCLMDAFGVRSSAACIADAPWMGFDHYFTLYTRRVVYGNGYFFSYGQNEDTDGTHPSVFALRRAVAVVLSIAFAVLVFFAAPRIISVARGPRSYRAYEVQNMHTMYNLQRAVLASVVCGGAMLIASVLSGNVVVQDLFPDVIAVGVIVSGYLLLEHTMGQFFAAVHGFAFRDPARNVVTAHRLIAPDIYLNYAVNAAAVLLYTITRCVAVYNYGKSDPGIVNAYDGYVDYGASTAAKTYTLVVAIAFAVYVVVPPLLVLPDVWRTANERYDKKPATSYEARVRRFEIKDIFNSVCLLVVVLALIVLPPRHYEPGVSAPACSG